VKFSLEFGIAPARSLGVKSSQAKFSTNGLFMGSFPINVSTSLSADRWNLTEQHSNGTDAKVAPSNCMQQIVLWLKSNETPLISKIAAVAFLAIGAGYLAGQTAIAFLAFLCIAFPVLTWAILEWDRLTLRVEEAKQRAFEQTAAFQQMQNAVGGPDAFHRLPILDIGNRMGSTGYLDFITPQNMTSPVMRGKDVAGRPFICLKMRSSRPEDSGQEFVVTFFRRYDSDGLWTWGSTHNRGGMFGNVIRNEDRKAIQQIVVTKNHPHFTLVR
jgi:hypothetical protein